MTRFRMRRDAINITGEALLAHHRVDVSRGGPDHALIRCPTPDHEDRHPSCSVNLQHGGWRCHGCGETGDLVALHRLLAGLASNGDALADLERLDGRGAPFPSLKFNANSGAAKNARPRQRAGTPVEVSRWQYLEADGTPVFDVVRQQYQLSDGSWAVEPSTGKPDKTYFPMMPGRSRRGLPEPYRSGQLRPLYRLPDLCRSPDGETVFVVEGEPAADALASLGLCATTSSSGAESAHRSDWSPLAGRRVTLWPDNDAAGRRYADEVISRLRNLNPPPVIALVDVEQLGLPPKGDAADWVRILKEETRDAIQVS